MATEDGTTALTSGPLITSTESMTAVFTPPPICRSYWTYEPQSANSVPGGLLLQNAAYISQDSDCFPEKFNQWGRAPSFIQIFSPGACPSGYKVAAQTENGLTTTAVCCLSNYAYTETISSVNLGDKTAGYYGCTSLYPSDAPATTALEFYDTSSGYSSTLNGTTTYFTTVSGPLIVWAQPIRIAYQSADLTLFTTSTSDSASATSSSTSTFTSNLTSTSALTMAPAPTPTQHTSSGLSAGGIAGTVIAAVAIIGIFVGSALFLRRKKRRGKESADVSALEDRIQRSDPDHPDQFMSKNANMVENPSSGINSPKAVLPKHDAWQQSDSALSELDANQRRHELST